MNLLFLVVAASGAEVTVPVSDANFYFTDYNWFRAGGPSAPTMATANPGATAKLGLFVM